MDCPRCGHENREGARFCLECGEGLGRRCPNCSAELPERARFCDGCGQSTAARAAEGPGRDPRSYTPKHRADTEGSARPALPDSFASGRYQVQRFVGEGAKKRVYLARDTRLNRDVAVAVIKSDGLDEVGLARVRREAATPL